MGSLCNRWVPSNSSILPRGTSYFCSRPSPSRGLFYTSTCHMQCANCGITNAAHLSPISSMLRWATRRAQALKAELTEAKSKRANLYAEQKQKITLPNYSSSSGKVYSFQEFLSHPLGIESLLNTRALQCFEYLDSNTYRCTLPKVKFLKFEVSPILVLRVTPANEYCMVEMLSCKFEGSESLERQNDYFTAFMTNCISWDASSSELSLDVDVKLNVTLEVHTLPFTLLPISAIETPGNLAVQRLVDSMIQLLVQHLCEDYDRWVQEQSEGSS
ncbi:hypothetical protein H6P81_010113 [Aristolochia fimbriata]|uniref:DUF1997 family protein n=1 Tax=Aristolochia fimbriata TaxID=158543 RepID=A0AAV7EN43_ARIFI|nr:hypothetical protein H6P81_010113 [Aristolochia fimbriata]